MAWEWKEDPPVQAQVVNDPRSGFDSLASISWTIFIANLFFILGFGLLVGYATNIVRNAYISGGEVYFTSDVYTNAGGYVAGAVIISLSLLTIFVLGIVLVAARRPNFQDQGLVTAVGIISILGGLFIVSGILSLVLISRVNEQRRRMAMPPPPPYGPAEQPTVQP